jgi:hypothetical protein
VRNSSLVEWSSTENVSRLKHSTEAVDTFLMYGRGAFCQLRSLTVRTGGADRSANAGMSSAISARTRYTESLRVPGHRQSSQGESGPKPRTLRRRRWTTGWIVLYRMTSLRAMGGRDREGEPIEWTGWVPCLKCVTEANPGHQSMTAGPSARKRAEVIGPQVAKKSLSPEVSSARTANRHW